MQAPQIIVPKTAFKTGQKLFSIKLFLLLA